MSKKVIHLLCSDADRAALQPVLDALKARGLRVSDQAPGKNDLVLAVLSEGFYAESGKTGALVYRVVKLGIGVCHFPAVHKELKALHIFRILRLFLCER